MAKSNHRFVHRETMQNAFYSSEGAEIFKRTKTYKDSWKYIGTVTAEEQEKLIADQEATIAPEVSSNKPSKQSNKKVPAKGSKISDTEMEEILSKKGMTVGEERMGGDMDAEEEEEEEESEEEETETEEEEEEEQETEDTTGMTAAEIHKGKLAKEKADKAEAAKKAEAKTSKAVANGSGKETTGKQSEKTEVAKEATKGK